MKPCTTTSTGRTFALSTAKSLLVLLIFAVHASFGQIKNVILEKYYVSSADDRTDTTGGRSLDVGAVTWRVYVQVEPGSRVTRVYGDANHPLVISSTAPFYNNNDRPSANFGYKLKTTWFEDNPILALDSWLTIGYATDTRKGVLKTLDPDGDQIAGSNNLGGTAQIPGGLLAGTDTSMGVLLTTSDGLVTATLASGFSALGFTDFGGNDTTVFGPDSTGSVFYCTGCALQQNAGVTGPAVDSTKVLVAQLTTSGELAFRFNISVQQPDGNGGTTVVNYVSGDDTLLAGEVVSPFLTYPQACGCNDPAYLEYSATYSCFVQDSCKTRIKFGCMDSLACNYDAEANFNIPSICCYPGYCNDLNIALVCPELNNGRTSKVDFRMYPNPGDGLLTVEVMSERAGRGRLVVCNALGQAVYEDQVAVEEGTTLARRDYSWLVPGIYHIRWTYGNSTRVLKFVKTGN